MNRDGKRHVERRPREALLLHVVRGHHHQRPHEEEHHRLAKAERPQRLGASGVKVGRRHARQPHREDRPTNLRNDGEPRNDAVAERGGHPQSHGALGEQPALNHLMRREELPRPAHASDGPSTHP